jgi:diguanylate cyclase (GGDEF)-like protein
MSAASVALATTGLLSLIMLALLGSLLNSGVPGVRNWLRANAALAVSLVLILLRGAIPDFLSVVVANMLVALASVTLYAGYARFLNRVVRWPWLVAVVMGVGVALGYWRYVVDSIPMRVLLVCSVTSAACAAIAVTVARRRPTGRADYLYRSTMAVALFFAACQALRGAYFMTFERESSLFMFATNGNVLLLAIGAAVMPVLSMCAMMMVHDAMLWEARDAVNHDFLTGALSRKGFEAIAQLRLMEADKNKIPLSLLTVDLDDFKLVNDTFGHAGGDKVLREFVHLTQTTLRAGDALGRIGGEEFGILLPRTDLGEAQRIAERLRERVKTHPVMTEIGACTYSISGGLAVRLPGEVFDHLAKRADLALYDAKVSGRNRICLAREMPIAIESA